MYWWNVSQLAEDFREERVTERERFKYYLAYGILSASGAMLPMSAEVTVGDYVRDILLLGVTVAGLIACYQANRAGDDRDLIARVFCLGWPILNRLLVLAVPLAILLMIMVAIVSLVLGFDPALPDGNVIPTGILLVIIALYYWRLYKYIRQVAGTSDVSRRGPGEIIEFDQGGGI